MSTSTAGQPRRVGRPWWIVGLAIALICAGFLSGYASSAPDGLEHVAETLGFADAAAPGADVPLADYRVPGVEDSRLSTGIAGVIGALVVLLVSLAVMRVVRRRTAPTRPTE